MKGLRAWLHVCVLLLFGSAAYVQRPMARLGQGGVAIHQSLRRLADAGLGAGRVDDGRLTLAV